MVGLGKWIVGLSVVTSALLLYVHERIEILDASYRIYEKSLTLSRKTEAHRHLQFEVARLRSPQTLQGRLEESNLFLTLPQEIRVLKIPSPEVSLPAGPVPVQTASHPFLHLLGRWVQVAQAQAEQ